MWFLYVLFYLQWGGGGGGSYGGAGGGGPILDSDRPSRDFRYRPY